MKREEKEWSLRSSKLIRHCKSLKADEIWRNAMRREMFDLLEKEEKRDEQFFQVRKSQIPNAKDGLFARHSFKNPMEFGLMMSTKINFPAMLKLPHDRPLTEEDLQRLVLQHEKTLSLCNAEEILKRDKKTGNYFFLGRTKGEIKKDTELVKPWHPAHALVSTYLQSAAFPNKHFSNEDLDRLDDFCVKQIGQSQKQAYCIYSVYQSEQLKQS